MADALTYAYAADIVKAERDANGDLLVYGKATGPDRDLDGQRCDPEWLKTAMPEWFEWGNIRLMHQPVVAGVGVALTNDGDDWYVKSKVIDDSTAKLIEEGALKGYSIGVKNPVLFKSADDDEVLRGGKICELSYVDRPCNPTTTLSICKMAGVDGSLQPVEAPSEDKPAFTPADMAKMVNKTATTSTAGTTNYTITAPGFTFTTTGNDVSVERGSRDDADLDKGAMAPLKPGGPQRYPINSVADLKDAIQAFGRGKASDKAEIKAHIKSEAKRLGRMDLIPDTWKAAAADLAKADGETHDAADLRDILQGLINCMKAELDELANGEAELGDIRQLLETVSMFCCWWQSEAWAGETASPYQPQEEASAMTLAANPDQTKAAETDAATDAPADDADKTAQPDQTKAADPETSEKSDDDRLAELVKSVLADAMKSLTEQAVERDKALADKLATVEGDLAKVLALPEAGGPVITRTAGQAAAARDNDRTQLLAQADELLTKADRVSSFDGFLATGYRERARELRERAGA